MKYNYHVDGTKPLHDEIFVFGSNLAGVHGAGAARCAMDEYGAVYGVGIGRTGQSYALPTKDIRIKTMYDEIIKIHVLDFIEYANQNPELRFFVTRVGCGLAGYRDSDIAPFFKGAPFNCDFPIEWKEFLQ